MWPSTPSSHGDRAADIGGISAILSTGELRSRIYPVELFLDRRIERNMPIIGVREDLRSKRGVVRQAPALGHQAMTCRSSQFAVDDSPNDFAHAGYPSVFKHDLRSGGQKRGKE